MSMALLEALEAFQPLVNSFRLCSKSQKAPRKLYCVLGRDSPIRTVHWPRFQWSIAAGSATD